MYRTLKTLGALSLAAAITTTARAQSSSRVSQQPQEVGPPAPVELVGTPREASAASTKKMSPMMASLTSAASDVRTSARAGTLSNTRTHAPIAAGAAQAAVSTMTTPSAEADRQLRNAFLMSGQSRESVDGIMGAIAHLLSEPDAGQVRDAQKHFAKFMKESPSWYRDNPPAEVLAVDAALARMSEAEAMGRGMSDRSRPEKSAKTANPPKKDDKNAKGAVKQDDKSAKPAATKNNTAQKTKAAPDKKSSTKDKKPSLWRRLLPFV